MSFIAALFSKDPQEGAQALENPRQTFSEDFLFALFIAQEETKGIVNDAPSRKVSLNKLDKERRDEQQDEDEEEQQQLLGHFCAPFVDGFCQANYCILHNPAPLLGEEE